MDSRNFSVSPEKKRMKTDKPPLDSWQITLRKTIQSYESTSRKAVNPKWKVAAPENSMAWKDLQKGRIASVDVNLPPPIAKMFADDAKKLSTANSVKLDGSRAPWVSPLTGSNPTPRPLMSLNLEPPPLSTLYIPSGDTKNTNKDKMDETKMFDVLSRVNKIMQKVAEVLDTKTRACVENRKGDNAICLFTFFDNFPCAIIGGCVFLGEHRKENPPPPGKIYEVWRLQFFNQLRFFLPPPLFVKLQRHVDQDFNMIWNMNLLESEDFKVITSKIVDLKNNPVYTKLWSITPVDCDPRDTEYAALRSAAIRYIEAEVKSFWTYEKIGVYLRMLTNSNQNVPSHSK